MTFIPSTILVGAGDRHALVSCEWGVVYHIGLRPPSLSSPSCLGLRQNVAMPITSRIVTKMTTWQQVRLWVTTDSFSFGKFQGEMDTELSFIES
jgi:hypothetical protein